MTILVNQVRNGCQSNNNELNEKDSSYLTMKSLDMNIQSIDNELKDESAECNLCFLIGLDNRSEYDLIEFSYQS